MNAHQLLNLYVRATRKAHRVRHEDPEEDRADRETRARAWDRLADDAHALHAMYQLDAMYPKGPPHGKNDPR